MASNRRSDSRRLKIGKIPNKELVKICEEFLEGIRRHQIAANSTSRLQAEGFDVKVTRQMVFQLIDEASKRGFFALRPKLEDSLGKKIAALYGHEDKADRFEVVDAEGRAIYDYVADRAAAVAKRLIGKVAEAKVLNGQEKVVHVGLGAGFTTMNFSRFLAHELRAEEDLPKLVFHALTSGFRVEYPGTAPISFFGLFDGLRTEVEYVGLFARPVVAREDYATEINERGAVEAFGRRQEIDIVITSLARADDDHGDLNIFLERNKQDIDQLRADGWVGDVMYRPYSMNGPMGREASIKAVTLFELDELHDRNTQLNKYLIIIASPCGQCGKSRAPALVPLLRQQKLAIWSHMVMDLATAKELKAMAPETQTPQLVTRPLTLSSSKGRSP